MDTKKLFKHIPWVILGIIGAFCLAVVALRRGEHVSALWIVVASVSVYLVAYRYYSLYIAQKVMKLDPTRATPAVINNDGLNYVPTNRYVLFGHHFAAIAGAGPLVGPVLAAQMGYLPGTLWLLAGVVLAGAVQDFMVLFISSRRNGASLGEMIKEEMGPVPGTIALFGCFLIMIIILAVLALIVVKALAESPWGVFTVCSTVPIALFMGIYMRFIRPGRVGEVSVIGIVLLVASIYFGGVIAHDPYWGPALTFKDTTITFALIGYAFVSALLPVWLILAPRDYLATFLKIGVIVGLALGIVVLNPELKMPAMTQYIDGTGPLWKGALFPFLFITIACGALSGFHGAVSSGLTPKAVEKENQIRMIGYGSMLVESFTAVIALIAAITISQGVYFSTNMSAAQITAASGVSISATSTPGEQADAAVKAVESMKVSDIEGNQMQVTWDSVDENGAAKTYEGAAALEQAAADIGETSIVSRTGGATTFAMGMANFLKSYLGGHDSMAFWYHFAIMFEALFILTTVDNGTRVARYQIGEMLGNVRKLKKFADPTWKPGNIITTLIATALWGGLLWMGVSDANGGINAMVPIFGISNQLLAAACFVLITVCVAKMGYWKHLWIPVVPLVWDIAVTFTADFQKIFGPLSYFTTASKYQAQIDSGELTGEALTNAKAALSNAYLDGVLSVFFLVMMGVFVVVGIVVVARTFAAGKYGAETTSEEPFVESQWFAPSSLVATALEKKVQREYSAKLHELVRNGQVAA